MSVWYILMVNKAPQTFHFCCLGSLIY